MRSLLQQLENNEAVLLMRLADELPVEDRAEVDQLLASDAGMRSQLAELQSIDSALTVTFAQGLELPSARQAAGVRRVSRAMTQFRLLHEPKPTETPAAPGRLHLRLPTWVYPFAAAAMLLIALLGYWGFSSDAQKRVVQDRYPAPMPDIRNIMAAAASLDADIADRQALATAENLDDVGSGDLGALLRAAVMQGDE